MADDLSDFLARRQPTAQAPLAGLTVLAVEDSRYSCEAIRLMCLRSGARLRRADCLRSARRHLQCYRPSVVIVDLGLPDGSGIELIRDLARLRPRVPALIATSGDSAWQMQALAAGADAFLAKPLESLSQFQSVILSALPDAARPVPVAASPQDRVAPDALALRDDLAHLSALLDGGGANLGYVGRFLSGIARAAHDAPLQAAAEALLRASRSGLSAQAQIDRVARLIRDRLILPADL
ncbi:response regulator [Albidovulum sp.]